MTFPEHQGIYRIFQPNYKTSSSQPIQTDWVKGLYLAELDKGYWRPEND